MGIAKVSRMGIMFVQNFMAIHAVSAILFRRILHYCLRFCILQANKTETQPKEHHNLFSLLKTTNIRNTTIILCMVW